MHFTSPPCLLPSSYLIMYRCFATMWRHKAGRSCQHSSWTPLQETRTYWFNPSSLEDEDEFMLVGLVLGLAIYNAVLLDFPLPLALYRKLIGQSCTLRDLQDMEPTLGKSLTALLQYEGQHVWNEVRLCGIWQEVD